MEAISAAASGIAVASIAIQLADSMKKLVDFWESVQDAPNNIRSVLDDLRLLSRVLKDIDRSQLQYGFDANTNELLESCKFVCLIFNLPHAVSKAENKWLTDCPSRP